MGRTHATSGAAAFLAVLPLLHQAGLSLTSLTVPVATLAAAGAATLPDLDHPQATVSRSLGPATVGLARLVARCTGGHRGGTHSPLAVAALSAGATAVDLVGALPRALAYAFLFALATAAVQLRLAWPLIHTATCVAGAVGLVLLSAQNTITPGVLPWAVAVGSAAHLVGDMLTREGVPLLWPVEPALPGRVPEHRWTDRAAARWPRPGPVWARAGMAALQHCRSVRHPPPLNRGQQGGEPWVMGGGDV